MTASKDDNIMRKCCSRVRYEKRRESTVTAAVVGHAVGISQE
jgi:hypothetical protein